MWISTEYGPIRIAPDNTYKADPEKVKRELEFYKLPKEERIKILMKKY